MSAHYFQLTVSTNNGKWSSMSAANDTLAGAVADAIEQAGYFHFVCGYASPSFSIARICKACDGSGETAGARRFSRIKCKACRGKDSRVEIVADVPFRVHANCGNLAGVAEN